MKSSQIKLTYPNSKQLIRNIFNINDEIMEENKNDLQGIKINIISPIKEEVIEEDINDYDELLLK